MSLLKSIRQQLGLSSTATQNFTLTAEAADGTLKLARGNAGATTQDILTVDANGKASFPQGPGAGNTNQSMIRLNTSNGYGSTNTKIRRFTNQVTNQGTDITYADSTTLGASFTINTSGVYAVSYADDFSSPAWCAVSLNTTAPTTSADLLPAAELLTIGVGNNSTSSSGFCSWVGYLPAGSVLRPHTSGVGVGGSPNTVQFTITRVS